MTVLVLRKTDLCILSLKNLTAVRFFGSLSDSGGVLGETSPNESLANKLVCLFLLHKKGTAGLGCRFGLHKPVTGGSGGLSRCIISLFMTAAQKSHYRSIFPKWNKIKTAQPQKRFVCKKIL